MFVLQIFGLCLKMTSNVLAELLGILEDLEEEEDSDSNAVVAESALDRLACGLGGKTVFPHIMQITPNMLQVRSDLS